MDKNTQSLGKLPQQQQHVEDFGFISCFYEHVFISRYIANSFYITVAGNFPAKNGKMLSLPLCLLLVKKEVVWKRSKCY